MINHNILKYFQQFESKVDKFPIRMFSDHVNTQVYMIKEQLVRVFTQNGIAHTVDSTNSDEWKIEFQFNREQYQKMILHLKLIS